MLLFIWELIPECMSRGSGNEGGEKEEQCKDTSSSWLLLWGKQESLCNQINLGKNGCSIVVWHSGGPEKWIPWPQEFGAAVCCANWTCTWTLARNRALWSCHYLVWQLNPRLHVQLSQQVFTTPYYIVVSVLHNQDIAVINFTYFYRKNLNIPKSTTE